MDGKLKTLAHGFFAAGRAYQTKPRKVCHSRYATFHIPYLTRRFVYGDFAFTDDVPRIGPDEEHMVDVRVPLAKDVVRVIDVLQAYDNKKIFTKPLWNDLLSVFQKRQYAEVKLSLLKAVGIFINARGYDFITPEFLQTELFETIISATGDESSSVAQAAVDVLDKIGKIAGENPMLNDSYLSAMKQNGNTFPDISDTTRIESITPESLGLPQKWIRSWHTLGDEQVGKKAFEMFNSLKQIIKKNPSRYATEEMLAFLLSCLLKAYEYKDEEHAAKYRTYNIYFGDSDAMKIVFFAASVFPVLEVMQECGDSDKTIFSQSLWNYLFYLYQCGDDVLVREIVLATMGLFIDVRGDHFITADFIRSEEMELIISATSDEEEAIAKKAVVLLEKIWEITSSDQILNDFYLDAVEQSANVFPEEKDTISRNSNTLVSFLGPVMFALVILQSMYAFAADDVVAQTAGVIDFGWMIGAIGVLAVTIIIIGIVALREIQQQSPAALMQTHFSEIKAHIDAYAAGDHTKPLDVYIKHASPLVRQYCAEQLVANNVKGTDAFLKRMLLHEQGVALMQQGQSGYNKRMYKNISAILDFRTAHAKKEIEKIIQNSMAKNIQNIVPLLSSGFPEARSAAIKNIGKSWRRGCSSYFKKSTFKNEGSSGSKSAQKSDP